MYRKPILSYGKPRADAVANPIKLYPSFAGYAVTPSDVRFRGCKSLTKDDKMQGVQVAYQRREDAGRSSDGLAMSDVRLWHKADILTRGTNVRFRG
jgi:hypothetical protein